MRPQYQLILYFLTPFFIGVSLPVKEMEMDFRETAVFNPDHLDGAFTGGFGEESCHSCHFDYDLNRDGGSLSLEGLPEAYQSGEVYEISLTIQSEHLEIGGFQMTSRFENGDQAGRFAWDDERITFTPTVSDEIQYLQHSGEGTDPTEERAVTWNFTWHAPDAADPLPVIFNIAANAGNNDDSAFGDWIYVKEKVIESPDRR